MPLRGHDDRCRASLLHKTFAATMPAAHAAFSLAAIIRKSNRSFRKILRQPATRQFVLRCNIVPSPHCNMNSAMQHGTDSCSKIERRPIMVRFSLSTLSAAAIAGALVASSAVMPAHAEAPLNNLGPVGPREPILISNGDQRVIAFYEPERGGCAVNAVTWKDAAPDAPFASTRVRISLKPGQMFQLDGAQRQSISLLCGADASTLAVAAPAELILTGATGSN
jgi:hypothetical protein